MLDLKQKGLPPLHCPGTEGFLHLQPAPLGLNLFGGHSSLRPSQNPGWSHCPLLLLQTASSINLQSLSQHSPLGGSQSSPGSILPLPHLGAVDPQTGRRTLLQLSHCGIRPLDVRRRVPSSVVIFLSKMKDTLSQLDSLTTKGSPWLRISLHSKKSSVDMKQPISVKSFGSQSPKSNAN